MTPPSDAPPPDSWFGRTLSAARAGSSGALDELFAFFRPYLLALADERVGSDLRPRYAPSDAVQDTFLAARAGLAGFRGHTAAEAFGWLRQVLLNRIADAARRSRAGKRAVGREIPLDGDNSNDLTDTLPAPELPPDVILIAEEDEQRVRSALEALPNHYAQVIVLRMRDGLTYDEIGKRVGSKSDAVRQLFKRACEQLRHHLGRTDAT